MKPQVVLSLFDGMSCGQIALNRLGIPIKTYYASEIDPYPIKVTQANYPDTVQLGDVRDISLESLPEKPDIILAGSPCTGFSFAGKRLAFDDPQSVLFFEFVRLLKEIEPKWFLLENVNILETNPDNFTLMSSKFVTRQKDRKCLIGNEQEKAKTFSAMECIKNGRQGDYIACDENGNTKQMDKYKDDLSRLPEKADVIKSNYYKSSQANFENDKTKGSKFSATGVPQKLHKPKQVGVAAEINGHDILKRVYSPDGKSPTLNSCSGGNREPKVAIYQKPRGTNKGGIRAKDGKTPSLTSSSWQENNLLVKAGAIRGRYNGDGTTYQKLEIKDDGKNNTLTTVEKDNVLVDSEMRWRKLTPIEAERLQTVDDNYTAHVSNSRRYHMLGNGWTIEIICHILKNMVIVEQGGEVEDRKGQIGFEF
jgi:DNA-cytosine methyltransferase